MRRFVRLVAAVTAGAAGAVMLLTAGASPTPSATPLGSESGSPVRVLAAADDMASAASALVAAMPLREKAATVVMGHIPTTDASALSAYMSAQPLGGFLLMGENVPESEAALRAVTAALTADDAIPPLIAVDQEGGDVSRLGWDGFAGALTLKDATPAAVATAFAARSALVQRSGIGVNFGVVADVTADPAAFIYRRALGTTPDAAAAQVAAAVSAEGPETVTALKHFPGHGGAAGDSHEGMPTTAMTKAQWLAGDALPFRAGIDAGAGMLMFGHLAYTAVDSAPASVSAEWHRIARDDLGFTGVAVTDDLGMLLSSGDPAYADPVANAVTAIVAGNDLVVQVAGSDPQTATRIVDGIVAAVDGGILAQDRLDDAATRVTALRLEVGAAGRGAVPCGDCVPVG